MQDCEFPVGMGCWETSVDISFVIGGVHAQSITFDLRCRMEVPLDVHVRAFMDGMGPIVDMEAVAHAVAPVNASHVGLEDSGGGR